MPHVGANPPRRAARFVIARCDCRLGFARPTKIPQVRAPVSAPQETHRQNGTVWHTAAWLLLWSHKPADQHERGWAGLARLPWDHGPRGDRTSCKRQVSGSNPLTGSTFPGCLQTFSPADSCRRRGNVIVESRFLDTEIPTKRATAPSRSACTEHSVMRSG